MNHEELGRAPVQEETDQRVNPVTGVAVDNRAQAKANVDALTAMMEREGVAPKTPSAVAVAEQADAPTA